MLTQYNIDCPNEPALHDRLVRLLIREKIDFQSMLTARRGDKTLIQFLAPEDGALRDRLKKMGMTVREEPVFQPGMPRRHSDLRTLAKTLAEKDISVLSLYSVVEGGNMRIVLAVDRPANAVALIEKLGYDPDYSFYD